MRVWQRATRPPRSLLAIVLVSLLVGSGVGWAAAAHESSDRIVAGQTAGGLSVLIQLNRAQIVFGGGDSRDDLADLVGRSTLPWRRTIDLLVVPAWDNKHATGALGLVERGHVARVLVVGEPGSSPVWPLLEQQAHAMSTDYAVISEPIRVDLGGERELRLGFGGYGSGNTAWATAQLRVGQVEIMLLDAASGAATVIAGDPNVPTRSHLVVALRSKTAGAILSDVLIEPKAERSSAWSAPTTRFTAEIARDERLTARINHNTIQLPRDRLKPVATFGS